MAPPPNRPPGGSGDSPNEDSLRIARSLRATMSGIADQIERQNNSLRQQQALMESIKKAQENAAGANNSISQLGSEGMTSAIESAIEESESLSNSLGKVGGAALKSGGMMDKMGALANGAIVATTKVLGEMYNGFKSGMKLSTSFFGNIIRMGRTVVGTITDIAKVIIGLPGTFLDFMQGAATGGTDAYRQALEDLRKEFGDLSVGTSRSVITMTESMRNFSATGVSFGRIFGYGREGLAKLLQEFMKLAQEMGPLFTRFQQGTRGISREVIVLTKSSNITGEGLRAMQLAADNGGESVRTATLGMIRSLAQAQRTFGISVKEMGRDVNYMLKEYGTFGNVTRETMIRSSVYVRRLGMSIEALKKVMDKFLNFDDAAQSAAGMAEAFNMNIDAMRMMREQDPTKRLDMMREAFFRTGRNIDQMSVAERRHLSNLTGLSEEETRMAFSQRNRAMTGAALDAQMRRSQRTQVTQAQALQTLARSIERLVQAGQPLHGSFFQIFIDGFRRGIMMSREFRGAVRAIQQSMHVVLRAGREVGRMFAQTFPGFKQFFEGVKEAFNPRRFRALMNQVKTEFRTFFGDLANPDRRDSALGRFMTNMRQNFLNHFTTGSPAARRTMQGFRTFFTTIGRIAIQGARYFMEMLAKGVKDALEFVKRILLDERGISTALRELLSPAQNQARGMGEGLAGTFREVIAYAGEQLGPAMRSIWDSVSEFINDRKVQDAFEQRIGPPLRKAGEIVGKYFLASMFGPAVIGATLRGVGSLLTTVLGAFITRAAVKSAGTATAEAVGPVLRSLFTLAGAAKATLAAVVALTVGFSLIPERTVQFVRKAMEMFNGLGDKIGFLLGRLILGIGILIKTAWNAVIMALTNPATMLTYVARFGVAVLQAVASIGALIVSAMAGLFAGVAEGLGFKKKADEMRREFAKWKADFTNEIAALPAAVRIVIDDIGTYLRNAFPRIAGFFDRIGSYAARLRNALSIGRNEPPTLVSNIETASRRAAASSNTTTQQVVANAQRAQQASQNAQQAAQTAQRATQTAQNAAQGVANAATPSAPGAEARMINPDDFRRSMTQVRTVVSELATMAGTTFREFSADQASNVRRGVQIVTQILEAMKLIPEVANSLVSSSPNSNAYTAVSSLVGSHGLMSFLFDTSAHAEAQKLKNMMKSGGHIEQFVNAMPRDIVRKVTKIESVFTALKSITDVISSLGSSGGDANNGNVYSRFIEPLVGQNGILPLLFDFNNSPSAVKFQEMFMRDGSIEQFANSLPDNYRSINRRLNSVSSVIGTVNQIVTRVAENTERVATTFTTNSLVQASATFRANYVGQIDSLVTDFNRATAQLSQLNVGNVDMTLDRIGDTLSRERTVRLEKAAANVSVNVNIKLNAADISQALYTYSASPRARNVPGAIREGSFIPRTEQTP
jgi:hypothetical protein